jgi:hypothetical protein
MQQFNETLEECRKILGSSYNRIKQLSDSGNWDEVKRDLAVFLESEYHIEVDYLYSQIPGQQKTIINGKMIYHSAVN